jgi:predicted O-methyltransferase YrrM
VDINWNELYAALINGIDFHVLGKKTDSYDVLKFANINAAFESAKYYSKKMNSAKNFESDLDLLKHAMNIRGDGLILEFGVASGRTINHISSLTDQAVYGFDVFSGLPEDWRTGFVKGTFAQSVPKVNENVELVVGLFDETLPKFTANLRERVSLLHVDCDLYDGTKTIFRELSSFITAGTVIVFDEYFNYPGWEVHEFKAFQEFVASSNIRYRYDSFVSKHQQVCVVVE